MAKKDIKTRLICIDGADNTGKSTLIDYMKTQEEFRTFNNTLFLSFPTDEFKKNRENGIISVDNNNFEPYLNDIVSNLFTEIFKNEYDYIVCDRSYLSTYIYNYICGNGLFKDGREDFLLGATYEKFMQLLYLTIEKQFGEYIRQYDSLYINQVVLLSTDTTRLTHKKENDNTYENMINLNAHLQDTVNTCFKLYCNYFYKKTNYSDLFWVELARLNQYNKFTFKILNTCIYIDTLFHNGKIKYKRKNIEDIYADVTEIKSRIVFDRDDL